MKKWTLLALVSMVIPFTGMAQDDDMYFVPSKKQAQQEKSSYSSYSRDAYYSGSNRDVDEYNRRGGSYYEVYEADSVGNDIIDFSAEEGVYPDSVGDFALTRQMARWDGYTPADSYWQGYDDGRNDSWGWHSPWYYSSFYPWYDRSWYWDSWYYDPWYYSSWRYGWYDPWYYGHYGYYGWGWGGQGYSGGTVFDYMHFSILESGG